MTTRKHRSLDDVELVQACRSRADAGSAFVDSALAQERREVREYYTGKRPLPLREGGSKFVSQDVYLSVETMKAEVVETFGAGANIVSFSPQGPDDIGLAKQATALCAWAIHRQNSGLEVFQDVIHDGLTNRVGIAKVLWDRKETSEDYSFEGVTQEQAAQLLQDPEVRLLGKPQVSEGLDGLPVISGEFERVTDASQVAIEALPPEEFIISGRTKSLAKAPYLAHRYRASLGELVEDGYDEAVVYSIEGSDDDFSMEAERLERDEDTAHWFTDDDAVDEAGRMVTVHESYIRIDAEGTGRQQLWKVVHVGSTLLEKQKVSDHPFVAYVPQPLPHTFWGNNFAARTIQHANTKTVLTRAIIEQAVDATNPRWMVARGGVANPRELIDNRKGGVVNVRSLSDSVAPLPQASINPFVLQTIGMVDSDREDTTGISRLSQGLDKKALSHQNSAGLVEQLTSNSQTRTKVIARHFAAQFVSQLYLKVYSLIIQNETREKVIEMAGDYVECTPAQWASRRDVSVDMTLGYGERDQRVSELISLHEGLKSDPQLGRMYGEQQRYNIFRDALEIKGIKRIADYLVDPKTLGPQEPNPKEMAELEKLKKETEVSERQMALREAQVQADMERSNKELEWKLHEGSSVLTFKNREQKRKEDETANRIDISLAELELAVSTAAKAEDGNTKITAIASPNS